MIRINKGWTLFLDRDGVINRRIPDDYVSSPECFLFEDGVAEAIKLLTPLFQHIIVVTNQQGIGKGLMTETQLSQIHNKMISEIQSNGGKIDKVFFSPDLKEKYSFTRKPSVGMGLRAKAQFPDIQFKRSFMVGDTHSDILFGHRLGMKTVLISKDRNEIVKCSEILTYRFDDLISFAKEVKLEF